MSKAVKVRGQTAFIMVDRDTFLVDEYYSIHISYRRYAYFRCLAIQPDIEMVRVKKMEIPKGTKIVKMKYDWS
jgi:hypothetical protein